MSAIPTATNQTQVKSILPAFLRDLRVLQVIGQIVFAIILILAVSLIWSSILSTLQSRNLTPNFAFLETRSGFDISEHPDWYSSSSTYGDAFAVGLINTLRVVVIGLVATTIIGILGGIFLLSSNWLIRTITRGLVEILRNTPLLVQLFVWYFVVMLSLPLFQQALTLPQEGVALISVRLGLYLLAFVAIWFAYRKDPSDSPRRAIAGNGLLAAIIAIEVAFRLAATQEGWSTAYASGNLGNPVFLLYLAISIALLVGVWFYTSGALKWRLIGIVAGQLLGGLLFYFGVIPNSGFPTEIYPILLLSNRGLVFPEIVPTARFATWMTFVVFGVVLAGIIWVYFGRIIEATGEPIRRTLYVVIALIAFPIIGWIIVGIQPLPPAIPVQNEEEAVVYMSIEDAREAGLLTEQDELQYSSQPILYFRPVQRVNRAGIVSGLENGSEVTPQYMALLIGLVVYTAAFIAEIVRAGILAVPRGQIEASRALGLSTTQTLRMVILPQSLRVIIPPLGNQYLNLSKNSSLAIAVAYADMFLVSQTVMNQSGQSVTGFTIIMLTYLAISLIISALVNLVNRRFQLVTR